MAYYLGIDGGGSKTACAVADESSLLATIIAGPSNITRVGEACAREALQKAIRDIPPRKRKLTFLNTLKKKLFSEVV